MRVRIKKLDEMAQIPSYAKPGDAGMDLVAISQSFEDEYIEYGTGLAIEIPEGYVGLLFPRSSISKKDLILCNSVGVIDSGYRGEIKARFNYTGDWHPIPPSAIYNISDKIIQMVIIPVPTIVLEVVDDLEKSERGEGGFGSSGR